MSAPAPPTRSGAESQKRSPPAAAGTIEIALATYNSERFLAEQLDSLFGQSVQDFTLIIADDGSTDATMEIIADYSGRYPGRIRIVAKDRQPGGPLGNFARLIDAASADYLMLCDHDDVWLPGKIALSLARMAELESARGPATPLLVHSDLVVADEQLETLSPSLFAYARIDPSRNDVASLLTRNVVTGCTVLANRALYRAARPVPAEATMHDHWMALVASGLGGIAWLDEPTILYRQHGRNAIGVSSPAQASLPQRIRKALSNDERHLVMWQQSRQAEALLERCGDRMSGEARRSTEAYARLGATPAWGRLGRLRRGGLASPGPLRNLALLLVLLRNPPNDASGGRREGP
jgi:glycosyltransferase involved in cell wall biosynthesis